MTLMLVKIILHYVHMPWTFNINVCRTCLSSEPLQHYWMVVIFHMPLKANSSQEWDFFSSLITNHWVKQNMNHAKTLNSYFKIDFLFVKDNINKSIKFEPCFFFYTQDLSASTLAGSRTGAHSMCSLPDFQRWSTAIMPRKKCYVSDG